MDADDVDQIHDKDTQEEGDFNHEPLTTDKFDKMMEMWKQEATQAEGDPSQNQQMMEEWSKMWEEEGNSIGGLFGAPPQPKVIVFQDLNQYKEETFKE